MDAVLTEGWLSGQNTEYVAEQIGVSTRTAGTRASQLGLVHPKSVLKNRGKPKPYIYPKIPKELRFAQLLSEGHSTEQAAHILGYVRGNSVLQRIRDKLGWQAV
jgi:hypothetical protein